MSSEKTLRQLAEERGVEFGASLWAEALREDQSYWDTARSEFTSVTTSSALKMGPLRPEPKTYDFTNADAIVEFGNKYDMSVRGHTLVWHTQKPDWYQEWDYSGDQVEQFLRDHIHTVAGRYRGRIDTWDVVNEAVLVGVSLLAAGVDFLGFHEIAGMLISWNVLLTGVLFVFAVVPLYAIRFLPSYHKF